MFRRLQMSPFVQKLAVYISKIFSENIIVTIALICRYHEMNLPSRPSASVTPLNDYLYRVISRASLVDTQIFHDFLGINWDGNDIDYFTNFITFMEMILVDRLPAFQPEPPVFETLEDGFGPITAFENYLFVQVNVYKVML